MKDATTFTAWAEQLTRISIIPISLSIPKNAVIKTEMKVHSKHIRIVWNLPLSFLIARFTTEDTITM